MKSLMGFPSSVLSVCTDCGAPQTSSLSFSAGFEARRSSVCRSILQRVHLKKQFVVRLKLQRNPVFCNINSLLRTLVCALHGLSPPTVVALLEELCQYHRNLPLPDTQSSQRQQVSLLFDRKGPINVSAAPSHVQLPS